MMFRFSTELGETFQMNWEFTNEVDYDGSKYRVACFAVILDHCGQQYVEFFPYAKQVNLFSGYRVCPRCQPSTLIGIWPSLALPRTRKTNLA